MTWEGILEKAEKGLGLTRHGAEVLLSVEEPSIRSEIFKSARKVRRMFFGDEIYLYGFLYISTYCHNDCSFCNFRRGNTRSKRYRKSAGEIMKIARLLAAEGVHLIDLTMGEDPEYYKDDAEAFRSLADVVSAVGQQTGLPLMISPGNVPLKALRWLAEAGADWYACYQETHNQELFARLRPGQGYEDRLSKKLAARRQGMLIEEGLLRGVGETVADIAESLEVMKRIGANQVRVMNFVPQPGTPLENTSPPSVEMELGLIAVMRLAFPDRLIPASLDVDGLEGLRIRLDAGANVVTSIVPPGQGLSGVAQSSLDIEGSRRTGDAVRTVIRECGLRAGSLESYRQWLTERRSGRDELPKMVSAR